MRSPRFYKMIIAALVVINLGMLAFFWLSKPPHPPHGKPPQLSLKLELKGKHKTVVDALEKEHHKAKRVLMKNDQKLHQELFSHIGSDKDVTPILEKLDKNKREIESMTYAFFNEVASHCNDKQKKELRKEVRHMLNKLRPGPKGRRPPPK